METEPTLNWIEFKLYPGPTNAFLTMDVGKENFYWSFKVIDGNGRVIKEVKNVTEQLVQVDLTAFPAGMYSVEVTKQEKSLTRSFIKN